MSMHIRTRLTVMGAFLTFFLLVFFSSPARCIKIIDPDAKQRDATLVEIADLLDEVGIDVRLDWASKLREVPEGPVLAPLSGYQTSLFLEKDKWMEEFRRGAIGGLAAVKTDGKNLDRKAFLIKWMNTEPRKRIFLSFAREDFDKAEQVWSALQEKGYMAFLYLDSRDGAPLQSAEDVGRFMRSAGNHFILDSKNARIKTGVLAEVSIYHAVIGSSVAAMESSQSHGVSSGNVLHSRRSLTRSHVVEVYGTTYCQRTQQALTVFTSEGVEVIFHDINKDAQAYLEVRMHSRYLYQGSELPYVAVDGRPADLSNNDLSGALAMLRR